MAAALQSPPPTRHLPALSYYTFYLLLNQFHINSTSSSSKSAHIILQEDSSGLSLDKQANNDVAAFSVLVPLVIWDYCKRWPSRNRISSFFSRPRKPQLYNWHFHSPRSCTVVTGTRARLNGVEKRSASLDTCCSYCFLLLSFILPILFLHFNFVWLHFILSLYSKRRGGGLNPKWFSHRKLGIFAKYVQSDSLLWPTKIILCFVISDKHIFSKHCQPSLFATDLVSSNIQTGSKVLAPLWSVQKHLSW